MSQGLHCIFLRLFDLNSQIKFSKELDLEHLLKLSSVSSSSISSSELGLTGEQFLNSNCFKFSRKLDYNEFIRSLSEPSFFVDFNSN